MALADILLDGLPVLDLLEIAPSTSAVAQVVQRDQSSISRIYRQVSRRLGLNFRKQVNGSYEASANQPLLLGLRLSSQWLRLESSPAEPRWLACGCLELQPDGVQLHPALPKALVDNCRDHQRLQRLLQERVLDLLVTTRRTPLSDLPAELVAHPLARSSAGVDVMVLRRDLEHQPAIAALVTAIQRSYREQALEHPQLEWLG